MLTPFILRRISSACPPSLASSTAPSLASTHLAEENGEEEGQGGREEQLRRVAVAEEEEERKEKKAMDLGQLVRVCDMRLPHDWYPYARLMRRKVIYHGGEGGRREGRVRCLTYNSTTYTRGWPLTFFQSAGEEKVA